MAGALCGDRQGESEAVKTIIVLGVTLGVIASVAYATYPVQVVAPVTVPLYAAAHVPGAQAQEDVATLASVDARLRKIEDKLDEILKIAKEAQGEPSTQPPGGGEPPPSALKSAAIKCAKCHQEPNHTKLGGEFAMFTAAGQFTKLTALAQKRVINRINTSDPGLVMPPPDKGKLTEEEKAALTAQFTPQ